MHHTWQNIVLLIPFCLHRLIFSITHMKEGCKIASAPKHCITFQGRRKGKGAVPAPNPSSKKAKAYVITPQTDTGLGLTNHNSVTHSPLDTSAGKVREVKHHPVPAAGHRSSSFKRFCWQKWRGVEGGEVAASATESTRTEPLSLGPYPLLQSNPYLHDP